MSELSGRSLTFAYMVALAIIALMSLASDLTLNQILKEDKGAATVINVAGRQRMLSQRIAGLIAEQSLDLPVGPDLGAAIDQFATSHVKLLHGDPALHIAPASAPELQAIYFGGSRPLDAAVSDFVARARRIAGMALDDPQRRPESARLFADAREPILTSLNAVVSIHQATSERQQQRLEWMQTVSLTVVFATLVVEALLIFRPMVRRIASFTQALVKIAATDPLTGLLNRRSFGESATAELSLASRFGRPTSLLMIDADRFKAINDRHGHGGGDMVLKALATTVTDTLRPVDLFGRLGGEEFAVLVTETTAADAEAVAERVRQAIADTSLPYEGDLIRFTVSIGVAAIVPGETTLEDAMERADAALYRAKASGRNTVVSSVAPEGPARDAGSAMLSTL